MVLKATAQRLLSFFLLTKDSWLNDEHAFLLMPLPKVKSLITGGMTKFFHQNLAHISDIASIALFRVCNTEDDETSLSSKLSWDVEGH